MAENGRIKETTYYALRPATPRRAWFIVVICAVVGIAMIVNAVSNVHSVAFIIAGTVLVVIALALGIIALTFVSSRVQHIVLNDEKCEVSGPGYRRQALWADVVSLDSTPDGTRMVLTCCDGSRIFLQAPGNVKSPQMEALKAQLSAHLAQANIPIDEADSLS